MRASTDLVAGTAVLDAPRRDAAGGGDQVAACLGIDARSLHAAIRDLYAYRLPIYWIDFLVSIAVGYGCLIAFPIHQPVSVTAAVTLLGSVIGCYRAAVFVHELAHMRRRKFAAFRIAWDALCGVPLLIPSFLYEMHKAHHSPRTFGSRDDGEYLPPAGRPWTGMMKLLGASLLAPLGLVLRFLVLAPLSWMLPQLRPAVLSRASALMIIDSDYRRPANSGRTPRRWLIQEAACFLWCAVLLLATIDGTLQTGRLAAAYVVMAGVSFINTMRVIVAHRYSSTGEPMGFAQQALDSNTFLCLSAELWAPLGLRYHAVHHLLPSLPYHALPEAHRRIMQLVPRDSPYRATLRTSFLSAFWGLLRTSQAAPST
ncbi:Fatty acid desaturase [Rhizobiales bacterium GAS113]|nr:Fatty acid desaturase [Rhizobiales bacterium GAS113]